MARGVKVGNAYIEVNYDVDTAGASRKISEFRAVAEKLASITADIKVDTSRATFRDTLLSQLKQVDTDVDSHSANWGAAIARNISNHLGDVDVDVDNHSNRWGAALLRNIGAKWGQAETRIRNGIAGLFDGRDNNSFMRGFDALLSVLPGRMESLFSGKGGPIGVAFGLALIGGVAGVLPALGAMISGALFAAIGGGAVAAGIALVATDSRVVAAAHRLKDMFSEKIFEGKGAEAFVKTVVPAIDKITEALGRWSPLINSMLSAASKFVGPLTQGVIGFVDGFIKPLERVMNSPFMTQIMSTVSAGLAKVGQAFGGFFDKFINNSKATSGAVQGLNTLFNLLASGITFAGNVLIFLASTWADWNQKGQDGVSIMDRIRQVFGAIGNVLQIAGSILMSILKPAWEIIVALVRPLIPMLERVAQVLGGYLVVAGRATAMVLQEVAHWLNQHQGLLQALYIGIGLLVAGLIAFKIVMIAIRVATMLWAVAQMVLNVAMAPLTLIVLAIIVAVGLLVLAIIWVAHHLDFFKGLWNTVWGGIKDFFISIWNGIVAFFTAVWNIIVAAVSFYIHLVLTIINAVLDFIKGVWNAVWGGIKDFASFIWGWIVAIIMFWVNLIRNWISSALDFIKNVWNTAWGWIKDVVTGIWNAISNFIRGIFESVRAFIHDKLEAVKAKWNEAWGAVKDKVHEIWNNIEGKVKAAIEAVRSWVHDKLEAVKAKWNEAWGAVKDKAHEIWNNIEGKVKAAIEAVRSWIHDKLEDLKSGWNNLWGLIKDKAHEIWNNIEGKVKAAIEAVRAFIHDRIETLKSNWNAIWGAIKDKVHEIWNNIEGKIRAAAEAIRAFIHDKVEAIKTKWNDIWEGMKRVLGDVWNGIVDKVRSGINSVIDIINKGIRGINDNVLAKIGIDFRIAEIPKLKDGGPVSGLARGGKVRGPGSPTSDSVPIMASRDEFMIKAKSARRIGYRNLAFMNRTGQLPANTRFASGGRVSGPNNALMEQHRNHVHVAMNVPRMRYDQILNVAARSGIPYTIGSTYRPGSRAASGNLDHHSEGRAVDFPGFNQDKFASFWEKTAGVIELIHRTNSRDYAIFGGKGATGGGGFFNEFLMKGLGWVMDHMVGPGVDTLVNLIPHMGVYSEIAKGSLIKIKEGLKRKIQEAIDVMYSSDVSGGGNPGDTQKWAGVASQALKMLGLPQSWLSPLLTLIGRESGGNPNAINRWDSNAAAGTPSMGLMQTIRPTFDRYKYPGYNNILGPLDNILAGLRYIQARYGSIFNVQQAVGSVPRGYKNGGWLMPGQLAYNETSEPEAVFNRRQLRSMGHGSGIHVGELHIHVGGPVSDAEAKRTAEKIRDEFVKLGRRNGGKAGLPGS